MDVIEHIMQQSNRVMQGTKYPEVWYFFHNALTVDGKKYAKLVGLPELHCYLWMIPKILPCHT
jgi:hypothetical protein